MQMIKDRAAAADMTEAEADELWRVMPNSPFRRLVEYELELRKAQETLTLSSDLTFEKYQKQKGIIEGLKIAIGILSRKDNPAKKS